MSNKKGFTLIELLAVIAIVGIILIILIPNISKTRVSTKQNLYETKKKSITSAYRMCLEDNGEDCMSIKSLIDHDYLAKENPSCNDDCLKNPLDNDYLDKCYVVGDDIYCDKDKLKALETLRKLNILNNEIYLNPSDAAGYPHFQDVAPKGTKYVVGKMSDQISSSYQTSPYEYIYYSTDYTFDLKYGYYKLVNPQKCQYRTECRDIFKKGTHYYTIYPLSSTVKNLDNFSMEHLYLIDYADSSSLYYHEFERSTLVDWNKKDTGVFSMEDDYGISFFFRGNIINNYLKFGKNTNGEDMWWRIVRINGDGTLRIFYDGTEAHPNGEYGGNNRNVGVSKFNPSRDDAGYIGFMYGNFGDKSTSYAQAHANINSSTMKTYLEDWYADNIVANGYNNYVADGIFCNDRTLGSRDENASNPYTGYGNTFTAYGAYDRLLDNNPKPILKCPQKNDAFTKNDTEHGNGLLTYPVGLITADEVAMSGNVNFNYTEHKYHRDYYMYKFNGYWTMTPLKTAKDVNYLAEVASLFGYDNTNFSTGVAPVLNLSIDAISKLDGKGTMTEPFVINDSSY